MVNPDMMAVLVILSVLCIVYGTCPVHTRPYRGFWWFCVGSVAFILTTALLVIHTPSQ